MQAHTPFNGQTVSWHTAMPSLARIIPLHTKQPSPGICTPFSIQICAPIPNRHLTLIPTSPHHLNHKRLPHIGKILPHPLVLPHRYNSPLYFEQRTASAIDFGAARPRYRCYILHRISPGTSRVSVQNDHSPHSVIRSRQDRKQREGRSRDLVWVPNVHCGL